MISLIAALSGETSCKEYLLFIRTVCSSFQGVLFVDAQVVQESSPEGKVYCARQGREASHARGTEEEGAGELEVGPCVLLTHLRNVIRNCMLPM
jgi:hypothetical protein